MQHGRGDPPACCARGVSFACMDRCARLAIAYANAECNRETSSWDVRTKHVTYENVPTLDHVRGIALYGPGATLFTLGNNNTAQQFDLNSPPQLVATVQHPANLLPPSPPVSIEEQKKGAVTIRPDGSIPVNLDIVSESDEEQMSPLARIAREMDHLAEREAPNRSDALSPVSSQASFTSRSSAGRPRHGHGSVMSKGMSDYTVMSMGSSLHSREPSVMTGRDSVSISSISTRSSTRSRPSRLRHEVVRSPEDKIVVDLFQYTKSRLSDLPYPAPIIPDSSVQRSTNDMRRGMLKTIFGWNGEAEGLIRDELARHPRGSPSFLLLTKWLGDIDTDIMATSSQSMTSSDWMLLALSGIGGQASQQKVARAYIQRLLEKGDVHTAATIMIGMGDQNDAIEIYVSHKRYMEALILTCYVYPADWGRQTQLLRKWGEWAVQHSQQALAIRCFSCTATESSEPYFSPPPQKVTFPQRTGVSSTIPEMLSPPLSPPGVVPRGPQRNMAKAAALKLVTSFGDKNAKSKFFGPDDQTPVNAGGVGVTPIAESALSPGGDQTAFYRRAQGHSAFVTPASARTATPGGFGRARLPSIGEMPTDVTPMTVRKTKVDIPSTSSSAAVSETSSTNGADDESVKSGLSSRHQRKKSQPETVQLSSTVFQPVSRAATASPMMQRNREKKPANPLPPPSPDKFSESKVESRHRNGSRTRKPEGLHIQWPPVESIINGDYMTTPELTGTTVSSVNRTPVARSVTGSVAGSVSSMSSAGGRRSPQVSERSYRSRGVASPITGRSLDPYINSLDAAQWAANQQQRSRNQNRERDPRGRSSSRKGTGRDASEDRGRSGARTYIKPAKRSPTSPVPMSPEEIREIGGLPPSGSISETSSEAAAHESRKMRDRDTSAATTVRQVSKQGSRIRRSSPEQPRMTTGVVSRPASRTTQRLANSRRQSPEPLTLDASLRGRSKGRDGSIVRSPSSPLPMSPESKFYKRDELDMIDPADDREKNNRSRARSRSLARERRERSTSRARKVGEGEGADAPEERERKRAPRASSRSRATSDLRVGSLHQIKLERQAKKEAAARELEERRRSLVRRPSAPPILHPEELSPGLPNITRPASRSGDMRSNGYQATQLPPRSQTVSPESNTLMESKRSQSQSAQIGLPATPKAMQYPKYDPEDKDIPDVPLIPCLVSAGSSLVTENIDAIMISEPPADFGLLPQTTFAPLPKTTYSHTPRHVPPRSMSAPIPEEPISPAALPAALPTHPAFHAALPPSTRRTSDDRIQVPVRKINPGESGAGTVGYEARNAPILQPIIMSGIDETMELSTINMVPPPPPPAPAPPILRELQHLAVPPPPPPVPLYRIVNSNNNTTNPASAVIEIVMDEDDNKPAAPTRTTPPQMTVPPLDASRTNSANHHRGSATAGHERGRSINDNSLGGRISRATDRMRSASRGATASPNLTRTKSPAVGPPVLVGNSVMPAMPAPYDTAVSTTSKWVTEQIQARAAELAAHGPAAVRHPADLGVEGGMI
jgi:hypothetical protein